MNSPISGTGSSESLFSDNASYFASDSWDDIEVESFVTKFITFYVYFWNEDEDDWRSTWFTYCKCCDEISYNECTNG